MLKAGSAPQNFKPLGTKGSIGGAVKSRTISAVTVTIGGQLKAGWFQWDGDRRQPGWQMQFDGSFTNPPSDIAGHAEGNCYTCCSKDNALGLNKNNILGLADGLNWSNVLGPNKCNV